MVGMTGSSRIRIWLGGFFCGAVAIAALVLIARTFFVQGLLAKVETSSGSMAPWLIGPHGEAQCDVCQMPFAVDALDPPDREKLDCPNCGGRTAQRRSTEVAPGEQVLIDRSAYSNDRPQRWQVVVFRCPDEPGTLCTKRVVGLPGESIEIRDGDIYINGHIARKSFAEQQDTAIVLHDSRWRAPAAGESQSGWTSEPKSDGWTRSPGLFSYPARDTASTDQSATLHFHSFRRGRPSPLLDDYAYNQNVTRPLNTITDVLLEFNLAMRRSGSLRISADTHDQRYEVVFSNDGNPMVTLTRDGQPIDSFRCSNNFAEPAHIVCSLFDRQLLLAIDGETIFQTPFNPPTGKHHLNQSPAISIEANSIDVELKNLRLQRDIFYTQPRTARWGFGEPYQLGPNEYFVLGDNSPISLDSRQWESPGLASKSIVGQPQRMER